MITVNKDVISYEENDELILVNMNSNTFFALDYVGTIIWKVLEQECEQAVVIKKLEETFHVKYSEIKDDVEEFLKELKKVGVIKND